MSMRNGSGKRDEMIYGHFIEHFHRQIYGGVYEPDSPLADEDGFRRDVLEAMKKIKVPILRWPGGCFVSSYHWKEAVGAKRTPMFDKSWRVEDPNTFGTDEYKTLPKGRMRTLYLYKCRDRYGGGNERLGGILQSGERGEICRMEN